MKKISNIDYDNIKKILQKEEVKNAYILGDIERYGLNGQTIELFVEGDWWNFEFILMRFCSSLVIYSRKDNFSRRELQDYFAAQKIRCISGMKSTVDQVVSLFEKGISVETKMFYLNREKCEEMFKSGAEEGSVKRLYIEDELEIQEFYCQVDRFKDRFEGDEGIKRIREQFLNGKFYGKYMNEKLIFAMGISAETKEVGVIDNIATAPEWRSKGIGYTALREICIEELCSNKKKALCWMAEGEIAMKLAGKLDFTEIGTYTFFYPQ